MERIRGEDKRGEKIIKASTHDCYSSYIINVCWLQLELVKCIVSETRGRETCSVCLSVSFLSQSWHEVNNPIFTQRQHPIIT